MMTTIPLITTTEMRMTTGNETGTEPKEAEGTDLGLVIGVAAAAGALALAAAAVVTAIVIVRRRRRAQATEDRPPQSRAFYQAVGAARPAYLAQNGKKQAPRMSTQCCMQQPRVNNYKPRSIDNRVINSHNSSAWYQPHQPHYRHHLSVAY